MDFDEYDYLEKTVENSDLPKASNGLGVKGASTVSKRRSDEDGHRQDDRSKRRAVEDDPDRRERSERGRGDRDRAGQHERERGRDVGDRERERLDRPRDRGDRDWGRERPDRDFRDRERSNRERFSREREREVDKEREKEKDKDRGRSKDRSHSRSRDLDRQPDRERERENSRMREKEKEPAEKEIEKEPRYPREKREKKEEPTQAEPEADPERDQRTVFAFQISLKADERDVYDFFSRAGKVRDVRLIMDRNSRRSKGVGYIEFYDAMSVPMAIAMTGQLLLGQPVMVKPSEAEKNLVQSTAGTATGAGGFLGPYSGGARRLYVGNLHYNITEDQLRQVFEPFGPVELVQLPTEPETGQCKGYGFVQYARLEDARSAQQALNGVLELAGRVIKVVAITDQMSMQDSGLTPGELDDDEGGGLSLTARSRALLMQKLDRSGTVSSITASAASPVSPALSMLPGVPGASTVSPLVPGAVLGQVGLPGIVGLPNTGLGPTGLGSTAVEQIGAPTDCLLLKNMFDPKTETDPDFDLDIKEEVQQECSKFGAVKHIFVDKNSAGHVYIRFENLTAAISAQRALHGRWFAGKMITTTFLTPRAYETKFPDGK